MLGSLTSCCHNDRRRSYGMGQTTTTITTGENTVSNADIVHLVTHVNWDNLLQLAHLTSAPCLTTFILQFCNSYLLFDLCWSNSTKQFLCHSLHYTTIIIRPFVRDYPGELVREETFTHPASWSSSKLYQLLPSTTIHSILPAQTACLAIFFHNFSPCPFWSTAWSAGLHLIFHNFFTQSLYSFPYITIAKNYNTS